MATPYTDIYTFFTRKISDYDFLSLPQVDLEEILEGYLISATTKFKKCEKDLTDRSSVNKEFTEDLDDTEKEILSILMMQQWLYPKIYASQVYEQSMNTKDFRIYSQANHVKEIRELYDNIKKEANQLISNYLHDNWDLSDLS